MKTRAWIAGTLLGLVPMALSFDLKSGVFWAGVGITVFSGYRWLISREQTRALEEKYADNSID